mmetsp:Transcript_46139/g.91485  ORF Transcript_46139/g.91485 Transcript_46139/m.91485 type:complete len:202 (-) Transcript_46139:195-800(-)
MYPVIRWNSEPIRKKTHGQMHSSKARFARLFLVGALTLITVLVRSWSGAAEQSEETSIVVSQPGIVHHPEFGIHACGKINERGEMVHSRSGRPLHNCDARCHVLGHCRRLLLRWKDEAVGLRQDASKCFRRGSLHLYEGHLRDVVGVNAVAKERGQMPTKQQRRHQCKVGDVQSQHRLAVLHAEAAVSAVLGGGGAPLVVL